MADKVLTLVSTELAEEGKKFIFMGGHIECTDCKFSNLCLNLEKGQKYKVVNVRKPVHDCGLTEGKVQIVEVEKDNRSVCVDKKYAIDGAAITFFPSGCGQIGCKHFHQCNPDGVENEDKIKIVALGKKAECVIGQNRVVVDL